MPKQWKSFTVTIQQVLEPLLKDLHYVLVESEVTSSQSGLIYERNNMPEKQILSIDGRDWSVSEGARMKHFNWLRIHIASKAGSIYLKQLEPNIALNEYNEYENVGWVFEDETQLDTILDDICRIWDNLDQWLANPVPMRTDQPLSDGDRKQSLLNTISLFKKKIVYAKDAGREDLVQEYQKVLNEAEESLRRMT